MAFTPNSTAARDVAYHLHPCTNLKKHLETGPLIITRGEGVRVWDETDRSYIEGFAGLWCASLGFSEERLVEAGVRALRTLPYYHSFGSKGHVAVAELAERLVNMAPVPMSKAFFANSGSEANDSAIKMVWYYQNAMGRPNKKKIISRIKAYHGVTVMTASLTGLPPYHKQFDLPVSGILHTTCPHYYRFGEAGESEEDFAQRCADDLEKLIVAEDPDTVAAMIAEPVMGAGGVIPPPATYFEKIQAVLEKYDILLIADEVVCGFGRTGNMWGTQTYNMQPDIITMAKALSSAYVPISAVLVTEPIFQAMAEQSGQIGVFGHGYTYSTHPVPAAVALETLKIYEERDIVGIVRGVMDHFQDGLRSFASHPVVGEVRGVGLVGGVELVKNKETRESFAPPGAVGAFAAGRSEAHGLINRAIMDTVAFSPPLIISKDEIDEMFASFAKALDDTEAMVNEKGLRD